MPAERRGAITGASSGLATNAAAVAVADFNAATTTTLNTSSTSSTSSIPTTSNAGMAFSFGAPAAAPAAAPTSGFSFGGSSTPAPAAPAPATGFSFGGGATPAPAPSTGLFGSAPAPGAPAPAPSGGLFGSSTPAPAPSTGLFGSTPAPAPSTSLFGAPAPAPSTSLFGAPAPAPTTSLFGAPAPPPAGGFGQPPAAQQGPPPALAGHMPYANLPPEHKKAIDTLHQVMMQHKRTVLQVSTMAPKLLAKETQQADVAGGTPDLPLHPTVKNLAAQLHQLQQQLQVLRQNVTYTKDLYEKSTMQAFMYAQWPTEAVAMRRGVTLTTSKQTMEKDVQARLQELLDREMAHVDRIERMPSPYLWQVLQEMEQRLNNLKQSLESLHATLQNTQQVSPESMNVLAIMKMHEHAIWTIASAMATVHAQVEQVRQEYRVTEKGTNVLDEADHTEKQRERALDFKMREQMVKSLPAPKAGAPAPAGGMFGAPAPAPTSSFGFGAPAPSSGGLFGSAPAPGGSLFGSTPAPAPGGSLFGSTPAPAPGGSLFGSTPAPAPGGSLFGTPAPAPAGGSLFGASTPTPAPAPSGGLFGSTPAPAPSGGAFGSTPAPAAAAPAPFAFGGATPAPAGGGLFGGAPTPAPATGAFGSTTSSTTPKSKNKSRSTRRR
eukprot:Nitzschia sp. Nitz4//scaffold17_size182527//131485//133464//NITZ4_001872-RA/size182527-processed-gene-0.104-mRNA-1//1//CDS//3329539394//5455//frame0